MDFKIRDKKVKLDKSTLVGTAYERTGLDHPDIYDFVIREFEVFGDDDVFLDAGANIGFFSLLIERGRAVAFEPVPETFAKLFANRLLNPDKDIECVNRALYSGDEFFDIVYDDISGCCSINIIENGDFVTTTIDGWCDRHLKDYERIRMIKIDCEGTDFEVLKGAERTLNKFHPVVIIEVSHIPNKNLISKFLNGRGYEIIEYANDWIGEWRG